MIQRTTFLSIFSASFCIDEELQLGIQGVACPIFDINGEPAAALAFTSLKDGNEEEMQERIRLLKAYAEEISEAIR